MAGFGLRTLLAAFVAIAVAPTFAQQPTTAPATLTLRGVVVTANDVPMARVRVAVTPGLVTEPPVLTDDRGEFSVRLPNAESVRLTFTKGRYAAATVDLPRGDRNALATTGLRVRMSLGGAISGQVRDRAGQPVLQVAITVRRLASGPASASLERTVSTNDLGEFRFGGLVEGAYAIGVRPPGPSTIGSSLLLHDEQTVNVGFGAEVSGIDLTIDAPSQSAGRTTTVQRPVDPSAIGALRGRVVTSRGVPIAGAVVQAYGTTQSDAVETDSRGRYVIGRLLPGDYRVLAFKSGFITPGPSRSAIERRSGGPTEDRVIAVGRGQTVDGIDFVLGRGAAMTGTIVDEFGEPMQDIAVSALELRAVGNRTRALRPSSQGNNARTDDRGRYRLWGLQPGTFVVQAVPSDLLSATKGYVPMFYPGATAVDLATPTKLNVDAVASGIDLTLAPQPVGRIRGILFDPAGNPPERTRLTLSVSARSGGIQTEPVMADTNADGTFAFNNVAPGDYIVQAAAPGRTLLGAKVAVSYQFAEAFVTVAGDDSPALQLKLSRGATLMGRVVYEGITDSFPPYSGIQLTAAPAAFDRDPLLTVGSSGFALLSDNTFEYRGVFGRSFLSVRPLRPNWYVKSVTYNGEDLLDSAFDFGDTRTLADVEIVVSGAGAAVAGRVTDDRAAPVRDYTVALFPIDRSKWTARSRWLKATPSSYEGAFRLNGIVPGEYWVVAVDRLDSGEVIGELQNLELLESLSSRATRIAIGEGQSQNLALRLVRR